MALRTAAAAGAASLLLLAPAATALAKTTSGPAGKLDSDIQRLVTSQAARSNLRGAERGQGLTADDSDRVLVDVYVKGDASQAAAQLKDAGMDVQASTNRAPVPMVEGYLPVSAAESVASLTVVRAVIPVVGAGSSSVGSVSSQGDAAHNGPQARALGSGIDGRNVKVGVISDSVDRVSPGLFGSVSSSDVPDDVVVLKDGPAGDPDSNDEGRAMMEIIHDTAEGLAEGDLFFASGIGSGPVGKANSVDQLTFAGVNIVADDIFYLLEPFFQDGVVSQAVENARNHGVAYFSSADNFARESWEGTFTNSNDGNDFENFSTTGGLDTLQTIVNLPNNSSIEPIFQWDEPWGQASTDLDIELRNASTGALLDFDDTANITTGIPSAHVFYRNTTGAPVPVAIRIHRFAGTRNPFMKYIAIPGGNLGAFTIAEWNTDSETIDPDAASAPGAIGVAAVNWADSGLNDAEPYSSRGPAYRLFDKNGNRLAQRAIRQQPLIAGADQVATSVSGFAPFGGTSAAVASVAGVAAVVKSARPSMSVNELTLFMLNPANSIDCNPPGPRPDTDCGAGFILTDRAVRQALVPGVTSLSPSSGATEVFPNANVSIGFNEGMNHAATQGAFTLKRASDGAAVPGSFSWFGDNALVFDPSSNLQGGVKYTATLSTAARSALGYAPSGQTSWSFTTTNRPVIQSISPRGHATGVSTGTSIVVGFSKPMNKSVTQSAFSLTRVSTGAAVPGSFTWFADAMIFKPTAPLVASQRYNATVSGAARDTSGNTLLNPSTSTFSTGSG
jgi:hypothetical protein